MKLKTRQLERLKAIKPQPTMLDKMWARQRLIHERSMETALEQLRLSIPIELISAAQDLVLRYREIDRRRAYLGPGEDLRGIRGLEERAEFTKQYMLRWLRNNHWTLTEDLWENIFVVAEERVGPWTGIPIWRPR